MAKTWAERLAARAMGTAPTDPDEAAAEQAEARRASRPPAPEWVQRAAARATAAQSDDEPTPAA